MFLEQVNAPTVGHHCFRYIPCWEYNKKCIECGAVIFMQQEQLMVYKVFNKCVKCKVGECFKNDNIELNMCEKCFNQPSLWQKIKEMFR